MSLTHVTEWGLGRLVLGRSSPKTMREWKLRPDTRACDGVRVKPRSYGDRTVILSATAERRVPTCPRCAVLRDEALEGRLPRTEELIAQLDRLLSPPESASGASAHRPQGETP